MYWERVSPQNIGPFRVHDAFMGGASLDLRSRLQQGPLQRYPSSVAATAKRWPKLELELQVQFPMPTGTNPQSAPPAPPPPAPPATNNSCQRSSTSNFL